MRSWRIKSVASLSRSGRRRASRPASVFQRPALTSSCNRAGGNGTRNNTALPCSVGLWSSLAIGKESVSRLEFVGANDLIPGEIWKPFWGRWIKGVEFQWQLMNEQLADGFFCSVSCQGGNIFCCSRVSSLFPIFLKLIYAVLYKDGPQASEGGRGKRTRFEYIWHIPGKLLVLFHFASIKYLFLLFPYVRAMV